MTLRATTLACGCVLGAERCFDCRPGLHMDQEKAVERAGIERLVSLQETVRQYREAWRGAIDQIDAEASQRDNWDGSDRNLQAFDQVMDAVLGIQQPANGETVAGSKEG